MILQALYDYYQRKGDLAGEGFAWVELPFLINISPSGQFLALEDTREGEGRFKRPKSFLLPKAKPRSGSKSYATTQLGWDHIGYVLGHPKSDTAKDQALAKAQHSTWRASINELLRSHPGEPSLLAIQAFYETGQAQQVETSESWTECQKIPGCNIAFRMEGDLDPVPCLEFVRTLVQQENDGTDTEEDGGERKTGICLITGDRAELARLHTRTPISKDSKSLVNFQKNCGYDSHGREQGYNAPVSKAAEAAYTTALKHLLSKDAKQRIQVGDATTIFWSGQQGTQLESDFGAFFGFPPEDNPDVEAEAVRTLYASVRSGEWAQGANTPFFVLGLAPNAARISVRFWHQDTLAGMSARLVQHLEDLTIVCSPHDPGRRALMTLLCDLVLKRKPENIPPNLAGQVMRAALSGGPYPRALLQLAIRRIRADREVTRMRAAVLKAVLNRFRRNAAAPFQEITVSLDPENLSPGYRLGRLFAILEKIQEDAQPGINATIRDRFYGAASSSPSTVFPQLLKLKNHHLAKLSKPDFRRFYEIRLGEVFDGLQAMPSHLPMDEQARFAIGYYHQRQALFTKTARPEPATQA
jgi:CRISPR-associated protein Csd1